MGLHNPPIIPGFHHTFPLVSQRRAQIEALVERLVDMLDRLDGDPDLEDDDPAGDPLDMFGEAPSETGTELMAMRPAYGQDQSIGPINEREACVAHREQLLI